MGNWILRWSFDKTTYSPGDVARISFWVENTGDTPLYFEDFEIEFDFGAYSVKTISGQIPQEALDIRYLGLARILLPEMS